MTENETLDALITETVANLNAQSVLTAQITDQRAQLVDLVGPGNNYSHELAKVVITNKTETRSDPNHLIPTFDVAAYNKLSMTEKTRLTKLGVVTLVPKVTKGQDPTCRITLV